MSSASGWGPPNITVRIPGTTYIPVIVLFTSKEESDKLDSYQLSVAGYIVKPVGFSDFVDAVKVIDLYWSLCELPQ